MIVVHVCRKPLSEANVAANVLAHGTGALHVDACRVSGPPRTTHKDGNWTAARGKDDASSMWAGDGGGLRGVQVEVPSGRWPANLVLGHLSGCVQQGTRKVKAITGTAMGKMAGKSTDVYGQFEGSERAGEPTGFGDADGMETVEAWDCAPGCPVGDLDAQSIARGIHGAGHARDVVAGSEYEASSYDMGGPRPMGRFGDTGGASRFFKQVRRDP